MFIKKVRLKSLSKALVKEGFKKEYFSEVGRKKHKLLVFSKEDKISIYIHIDEECVGFAIEPIENFTNPHTHVGLHLFYRLFKKSKDLDSFCQTLKNL